MLNKQRDDCSTSSNQEQKACRSSGLIRNLHSDDTFEEEIGSFCDSGQGAWSELSGEVVSNLSESVVSLASFDVNQRIHSVCTGTVIESNPQTVIRIVTSASLITSNDDANNIFPNLGIQVHLPNGQDVIAWMIDFDLHYNVILVGISYVPGIQEACLDRQLQFESQSKVVAIWRSFNSGKLMATAGTLIDEPSEVFPERLMSSTCKISTFGIGGPLVDFNGNFLGVNLYATEKTTFLPRNKLCEALVCPGRLRYVFYTFI
uniref:Uncharacterized protein n=1 Tax=Arundo donax TaxID=35708 RepID=A0A0A9DUI0_ARUDO